MCFCCSILQPSSNFAFAAMEHTFIYYSDLNYSYDSYFYLAIFCFVFVVLFVLILPRLCGSRKERKTFCAAGTHTCTVKKACNTFFEKSNLCITNSRSCKRASFQLGDLASNPIKSLFVHCAHTRVTSNGEWSALSDKRPNRALPSARREKIALFCDLARQLILSTCVCVCVCLCTCAGAFWLSESVRIAFRLRHPSPLGAACAASTCVLRSCNNYARNYASKSGKRKKKLNSHVNLLSWEWPISDNGTFAE